jgi:two-component system, LuxR family, response regulator FixJ
LHFANAGAQMHPSTKNFRFEDPAHGVELRESTATSLPAATSPLGTIWIVDDDERVRKSLRWLIETLDVPVQTFPSAEHFLKERDAESPGCLIVDLKMAGMSGLDLQRELRRRGDEIPIIVLTGHASVPAVVDALKHGATEFLQKPVDGDVMIAAVQRALAFDTRRRTEGRKRQDVCERASRLSTREREVLQHVVNGSTSKEIATQLSVSYKTVEAHRAKIMQKMNVESVAQLVGAVVSGGIMADIARELPQDDQLSTTSRRRHNRAAH